MQNTLDRKVRCLSCGGQGHIRENDGDRHYFVPCNECGGSGYKQNADYQPSEIICTQCGKREALPLKSRNWVIYNKESFCDSLCAKTYIWNRESRKIISI